MTTFPGFVQTKSNEGFVQYLAHEDRHDRIVVITAPRTPSGKWGVVAVEGPATRFAASVPTPREALVLARLGLAGTLTAYPHARSTYVPPSQALRDALLRLTPSSSLLVVHKPQLGTALLAWDEAVIVVPS